MPYHRLSAPTYFIPGGGPLPAGYDYLNDPVAGGTGTGIAAPADATAKTGGTYDGTYFIAELENANANDLNRPAHAVGQNTDALDDLFNRDLILPGNLVNATTSAGDASKSVTSNGVISTDTSMMQIIAVNGGPVFVAGVEVRVASVTGAATGGFLDTTGTLNFSATIPAGIQYYIVGGRRGNLTNITAQFPTLWDPRIADHIGSMYRYDYDITTVSKVASSSAYGDIVADDIQKVTDNTGPRNTIAMRAGTYTVGGTADWAQIGRFFATQPGTVKIMVDSGRATNVNMLTGSGAIALQDIALGTASTTNAHFVAQGPFLLDNVSFQSFIEAGSLEFSGFVPQSCQRLIGAVFTSNSTLTTSTASLKVGGVSNVELLGCAIEAIPSASTPTAHLLVDTYVGSMSVRNCRIGSSADGVDGVRINAVNSVVALVTFENCDIYHNGIGDAWAVRLINSRNVVFKNCRFFSERGQCVRAENSGVRFENCTFEAGTTTALTNPQLICGEGYVSGTDEAALEFVNCHAIYNAANIRATGAPTKAVIELGGRDTTPNPGRVEVNGLYIRPDNTGVLSHQFTTVLLLNHASNKTPNVFRNVTIDELARLPTGAGTLAKYDSGFTASALLLEAVGVSTSEKIRIENLRVINVSAPATSLARGVIGFEAVTATGVTLDGSTDAAGTYSAPLTHFRSSDVTDLHIFPTTYIETSSYTVSTENTTTLTRLRYHRRGLTDSIDGPIVGLNTFSKMVESIVYLNTSVSTSSTVVAMGIFCQLVGCDVIINGTLTGGALVKAFGADDWLIQSNTFRWANVAADTIADLTTADRSVLTGNKFLSTSATAPAVSHSGTTRIPDGTTFVPGDMNVIAGSAGGSVPAVY